MKVLTYPTALGTNVNPYAALWAEAVAGAGVEVGTYSDRGLMRGRPEVIHYHWPEYLICPGGFRPARMVRRAIRLALLAAARARGTKLVWTVHNSRPHELNESAIDRAYFAAFKGMVSHRIFLAHTTEAEYRRSNANDQRTTVIPHPLYDADLTPMPRENSFLTFGEVRSYRGQLDLVEAWRNFAQIPPLVIIGEGRRDDYSVSLEASVANSDCATWVNERVSSEALNSAIKRSRGVVLHYSNVLNSGAALLALSCGTPVILPRSTAFEELQDDFGPKSVLLYDRDDPSSLEAALRQCVDQGELLVERPVSRTWSFQGDRLATLFTRLSEGR